MRQCSPAEVRVRLRLRLRLRVRVRLRLRLRLRVADFASCHWGPRHWERMPESYPQPQP